MRSTGTVRWFNDTKGFGFITPDGQSKDVFVHASQLDKNGPRALAEGDRVEFDVVQQQKGPAAQGVRRI